MLWGLAELPSSGDPTDQEQDIPPPIPPPTDQEDPTPPLCVDRFCVNGTCDPDIGYCVCDTGWSGRDCDIENTFEPQERVIINIS